MHVICSSLRINRSLPNYYLKQPLTRGLRGLELIYQEDKMDWDDMDIMTQDLAAGYVPNEDEMTPFKASDVY